jgi:hypothetical protein
MGSRAGLEAVMKRKILSPCRDSNPDRPTPSLVAIPTELSRLQSTVHTGIIPTLGIVHECRNSTAVTNIRTYLWSME